MAELKATAAPEAPRRRSSSRIIQRQWAATRRGDRKPHCSRYCVGRRRRCPCTGATSPQNGGILVNPLDLQEGAERVAAAENIIAVRLNEDCNRYEFVLGFLNKIMLGVLDQISIGEEVHVKLVPKP
jgi:hypothetical protein